MVIIAFGLPGSGKSTFASGLAKRLRSLYFDNDKMKSENGRLDMLSRMKEALGRRMDIVLNATMPTQRIRDQFIHAAADAGRILFIEVRADEGTTPDRLSGNKANSEAFLRAYEEIKQQWEPMEDPHLVLYSTDDNTEILINIAFDHFHLKHNRRTDR
jgi:predicted kinase